MYLYNISVIIEDNLEDQVVTWLKKEFFTTSNIEFQLLSLMDSPHPGSTICIQLQAPTAEVITEIKNDHLPKLQTYIQENFGEKVFLFDSVMEYLPKD